MDSRAELVVTCAFLVGVAVADCRSAYADPNARGVYGIPASEYLAARETLTRAVIAEEGWSDPGGWSAVAHVYGRKYARRRLPQTTLKSIVERHSAALRPDRVNLTERAAMLRGMPASIDSQPSKREAWQRAVTLLDRWYAGRVADPCEGEPVDFGSAADARRVLPVGARRVACPGASNIFYEVRRRG